MVTITTETTKDQHGYQYKQINIEIDSGVLTCRQYSTGTRLGYEEWSYYCGDAGVDIDDFTLPPAAYAGIITVSQKFDNLDFILVAHLPDWAIQCGVDDELTPDDYMEADRVWEELIRPENAVTYSPGLDPYSA